jgi:pimeloyl-ACP methyl ester carboxylesterase
MRPGAVVGCAVLASVLVSVVSVAAQEVSGVEHWVEQAGLTLYVWEKYVGSPAGQPVVVLAHGSGTAGRESFDLQVPGKSSYSLMDVLAREGFDVFAPDIRGFGRSTRPDGHMTTQEANADLNDVVDNFLKLRGSQQVNLLGWSWGTQYSGMFIMTHPEAEPSLIKIVTTDRELTGRIFEHESWEIEGPQSEDLKNVGKAEIITIRRKGFRILSFDYEQMVRNAVADAQDPTMRQEEIPLWKWQGEVEEQGNSA